MYPLKDLLKLAGLARSTFYYYLKLKNTDKYKEVKDDILDIFNQNKERYSEESREFMKTVAIILTFCFCLSTYVSADNLCSDIYKYEVEDKGIIINGINNSNLGEKISVPADIEHMRVKKIASYTFFDLMVEEIDFMEGIEELSSYAISDCVNLKKVVIPSSCKIIGGLSYMPAIEYCENLETIEIHGEYKRLPLFVADCPNLKNIIFYEDVKDITNEFKNNFYKCEPRVKRVNPRRFTEPLNITIHGKHGSNIEKFANENGFKFVSVEDGISKADKLGLIPKTLEGTDLTADITRAEFAAIAIKVYENLSGKAAIPAITNPFTDTKDVEVLKAYNIGIVNGTSATTYSPNDLLNREQAVAVLTRVFKKISIQNWTLSTDNQFALPYESTTLFADDTDISDWAKESIYFMVANGIINGVGNNKFAPKNVTSREQALLIAVRVVENLK